MRSYKSQVPKMNQRNDRERVKPKSVLQVFLHQKIKGCPKMGISYAISIKMYGDLFYTFTPLSIACKRLSTLMHCNSKFRSSTGLLLQ